MTPVKPVSIEPEKPPVVVTGFEFDSNEYSLAFVDTPT